MIVFSFGEHLQGQYCCGLLYGTTYNQIGLGMVEEGDPDLSLAQTSSMSI